MGVFQSLIEHLKENLNWIWNSLSVKDQEAFNRKYSKIIQLNSNPMPPRTANLLINLIQDGSLEIKKGLHDVIYDNEQFVLKFNDEDHSFDIFDIVINATGPKTHLSQLDEDDRLLLNLENRRIVQPHPMGGIQIIPETNQVISPRYGTLTNVIAIGQMTNGVNKLRNGVKMIVDQVVDTVSHLYLTQQKLDK